MLYNGLDPERTIVPLWPDNVTVALAPEHTVCGTPTVPPTALSFIKATLATVVGQGALVTV